MGSIITHPIQHKNTCFFSLFRWKVGWINPHEIGFHDGKFGNLRWTMVACKRRSKISCVLPNCRFNLQIVIRVEGNMCFGWSLVLDSTRFRQDSNMRLKKQFKPHTYLASCRCNVFFSHGTLRYTGSMDSCVSADIFDRGAHLLYDIWHVYIFCIFLYVRNVPKISATDIKYAFPQLRWNTVPLCVPALSPGWFSVTTIVVISVSTAHIIPEKTAHHISAIQFLLTSEIHHQCVSLNPFSDGLTWWESRDS